VDVRSMGKKAEALRKKSEKLVEESF